MKTIVTLILFVLFISYHLYGEYTTSLLSFETALFLDNWILCVHLNSSLAGHFGISYEMVIFHAPLHFCCLRRFTVFCSRLKSSSDVRPFQYKQERSSIFHQTALAECLYNIEVPDVFILYDIICLRYVPEKLTFCAYFRLLTAHKRGYKDIFLGKFYRLTMPFRSSERWHFV
jgi:hypothetical protein